MSKVTLQSASTLQNSSILSTINANNAIITSAFDNTVSRNGQSPNSMMSNLDMNNLQILNLPAPATVNSPVRLVDVPAGTGVSIASVPPVGTSGSTVGLLNTANTYSNLQTFSGITNVTTGSPTVFNATGAIVTGSATNGAGGVPTFAFGISNGFQTINCGIGVAGSMVGTTGVELNFADFHISTDNVNLTSGVLDALSAVHAEIDMNGNNWKGARYGVFSQLFQSTPSQNLSANAAYVAVLGASETITADGGSGSNYFGGYWGGNFWAANNVVGGNASIVTGAEFDNYGLVGSTQNFKFGINIADGNGGTATLWDAAIAIYTLGASPPFPVGRGFQQALSIGAIDGASQQPLPATGTIFGTHLGSLTNIVCANGIDWSNVQFTGSFIKGGNSGTAGVSNFAIDGSGNVSALSLKSYSPTLGVGYSVGAGGTVTQATSKATGVTLNTITGQIITSSASLAGGAFVTFPFTNSAIGANDVILLCQTSGAQPYNIYAATVGAGSANIVIVNDGSTASESININYVIIKGSHS